MLVWEWDHTTETEVFLRVTEDGIKVIVLCGEDAIGLDEDEARELYDQLRAVYEKESE